jgi:hypothetical protein
VTPRRIVLAYGIVTLLGWLLVAVGVTDSPGTPYLIVDAALDSLVLVGLLTLWRPVWLFAVALTAFGELLVALRPSGEAALLVLGGLQLVLLLLPSLRRSLARRPLAFGH